MSDINITIETIATIVPLPNADKLEIAKILGTQTLVPKGQYRAGDNVVYFPPDVLIPADVSQALGVDKYLKHATFDGQKIACRVAACRLRGTPSYGFMAPLSACGARQWSKIMPQLPGLDVTEWFRAVKYEPPMRVYRGYGGGTGEVWGGLARAPDNFHRYTDIQSFWKYHRAFTEGMLVRVTEKIHGTNSRVGLLRVDDEWNFYGGSHNTARKKIDPEGRESVYWHPLGLPGVLEMLTELCNVNAEPKNDVILFGELYGPGVQDLDYGILAGEIGWRCYDCSVNGRYLDWSLLVSMCLFFGVPMVPVLYTGPFYTSLVDELTNGPTTVVDPSTVRAKFRGREGIVITSQSETFSDVIGGRLILKSVSADYRDRKGAKDDGEL
jgi:RNA ligase (TIGR02306 family)